MYKINLAQVTQFMLSQYFGLTGGFHNLWRARYLMYVLVRRTNFIEIHRLLETYW